MSYTKTLIGNLAMSHIGDRDIADINDEFDTDAQLLKRNYEHARDVIYQAHDWKWAKRSAALQLLPTPPALRYTYAFALPPYFARMSNVSEFSDMRMGLSEFDITDNTLTTDVGFVHMEYVANDWSEAQWPAYFADCVSLKLAAICAPRISHDMNAKAGLEKLLRDVTLPYSRSTDSTQQPARKHIVTSDWQAARLGSRNFNNLRRR